MASFNAKGLSPAQIETIEECIAVGGNDKWAAELIGCHPNSLARMRRRGLEIVEKALAEGRDPPRYNRYVRILRAFERGRQRLRNSEVENIRAHAEKDWRASEYILEKLCPEEFGPKPTEIHQTTTTNLPQLMRLDLSKLTDEELDLFEELVKKAQPDGADQEN